MAKYSDEFKLMIVREYLSGPLGFKLLVRKYEMKSHSQLRNWVNIYKEHGAVGLSRKKNNEVYSVQFKLDVLSFMKRAGASLTNTALHFGLTNPSMIASWNKKFLEGGAEALHKPKGRPVMSDKAKNNKNEYCEQIEPAVRSFEPLFADNRASKCRRESHLIKTIRFYH